MNRDDQDRIFTYLISSAKGCMDEPPIYGPLRLLDAYSMILAAQDREDTEEFYYRLDDMIKGFKNKCMGDNDKFAEGLDRALEALTDHIISK